MTQEDSGRIHKEALHKTPVIGEKYFIEGAEYEHPIAFQQGETKGFNEGIEAALAMIPKSSRSYEMIQKLKK